MWETQCNAINLPGMVNHAPMVMRTGDGTCLYTIPKSWYIPSFCLGKKAHVSGQCGYIPSPIMGVYGFTTFHHTIHLRRSGPAPLKRRPARQQQRPRAPRSGVAIRTPFGKEGGPGNS